MKTSTSFTKRSVKLLSLAVAVLLISNGDVLAQQTIKVCADSYAPYNDAPATTKPGYVIDILKAIFEKNGTKIDYSILPWKRAVVTAEKGEIDGVIGGLKSDTPNFIFPEEPVGMSESVFFVKKGNTWTFSDLKSLNSKCLGVVNGYSYGSKLDEYVTQNQADPKAIGMSSGDAPVSLSIHKLQQGLVDICVENKTVFWAQVAKEGLNKEDFVEAGRVSAPEAMYVAFSPKKEDSKKLAATLTNGIRSLRSSGELEKILEKYGVKDWAQ